MPRPTLLEHLHEAALAQTEYPLAERPAGFAPKSLVNVAGRLAIDIENTQQFMAAHGADPAMLGHMAINLTDELIQGSATGSALQEPVPFDGKLYYPVLQLCLNPMPSVRRLNTRFRHELRHFLQPYHEGYPAYARPGATKMTRWAGAAGAAAATYPYIEALRDINGIEDPLAFFAFGFSAMALTMPRQALRMVDASEWDANIFSLRTSSFRPMSLRVPAATPVGP